MKLRGIEPQAGQFVGLVAGPVIMVAGSITVELDRRSEAVPHITDDPVDRGARAFKPFLQNRAWHRIPSLPQYRVQTVDAVEKIHGPPFLKCLMNSALKEAIR